MADGDDIDMIVISVRVPLHAEPRRPEKAGRREDRGGTRDVVSLDEQLGAH